VAGCGRAADRLDVTLDGPRLSGAGRFISPPTARAQLGSLEKSIDLRNRAGWHL
jgi:hypothetical protein